MPTTQRKAVPPARAAHQPPATDAPAGAKAEAGTETRNGDASTPDRGDANQGSPAAPVMKQFAKTDAESGDKR